jgi:mRNA-degrading endonuclease RelE of RelBE toxin-antitoxin system
VPVDLAERAKRDLRGLDPETRRRLADALRRLDSAASNLDVVPLKGRSPWLRLRVGGHRVLYRRAGADRWWVARIVDRRDLDRAVGTLVDVDE